MKEPKTWTDETVIESILGSQEKCGEALSFLWHELRPAALGIMRPMLPGDEAAADEIFDQSILVFKSKVERGVFRGDSSIGTFIIGICKLSCIHRRSREKEQQARRPTVPAGPDELQLADAAEDPLASLVSSEADSLLKNTLSSLMARLGENCRGLLIQYYFEQKRLRDMAEARGIGEQSIKNALHRCREKLRNLLLADPTAMKTAKDSLQ
ncbi:MAG: sigma-70 family RNA polymerase sigma factor [Lewinellaceae bacterium]|nr:sigma-70 family RNA polymerase sigma factor [Saprospiraceae bacterium]MCB9339649.1 sigma-70 family RNA polymerase sigma factor [Lewinellaceae bacterium]